MKKLTTWLCALAATIGTVFILCLIHPLAAQLLSPLVGVGFGAVALLRMES